MEIHEIISDVRRAKNDLAALAVDESVTLERYAKCEAAAMDLETAVTELLTTAWIPKNSHELTACIVSVNTNLRSVQADIAAALDVVLLECLPDQLYRAFIGLSFARILEFERDVLMTALARVMENQPQGHIWIN